MKIKYEIASKTDIKSFLRFNHYSLEVIHNLFQDSELIKVNNHKISYPFLIKTGDVLEITLPREISNQICENEPIDIVYEDDYIIIVNKPMNLASIATSAHYHHNLGSRVLNYFKNNNIYSKVHFINRLDKETQGLVLIAKHQYIHNLFAKTTKIVKKYRCFVKNKPAKENDFINLPIGKMEGNIKRFIDFENGKYSLTEYSIANYDGEKYLLDITLHTGRTHQIRLHLASIGCPLIGDPLYNENIDGEFYLQSYYLEFIHPITKENLIITI